MEIDTSDHAAVEALSRILPEDTLNINDSTDPVKEEAKPAEAQAKTEAQPEAKTEAQADNAQAKTEAPTEDVEIEIKGERYKVPPAIRDSIMMQADYTRKTQELAEQRKAFETERAKVNPQEIEGVKQKLTHYEQLLGQAVVADQQTDWVKLLKEDPIGYLEQKEMAEKRAAEWRTLAAKKDEENQVRIRQTLEQEVQQLMAKRPEWKDVAVYQAERGKIDTFLAKSGYRPDEITGIADHRALLIADKAHKYDELMASKADVAKKIEKLPPKVERPGVAGGSDGQASQAAMAALRKTGSIDDAAAALRSLMN